MLFKNFKHLKLVRKHNDFESLLLLYCLAKPISDYYFKRLFTNGYLGLGF